MYKENNFSGRVNLRAIANSIVQKKINPNDGSFSKTDPPVVPPYNTVIPASILPNTGAASSNSVYITRIQPQTQPADLNGQDVWEKLGVLKDPASSNGNKLTRMHQINGILNGPSQASNMFLGTRKSNNSGAESHLHQVETPVKNWIAPKKECYYGVKPNFGTIPNYIMNRVTIAKNQHKFDFGKLSKINAFENWAKEALPEDFDCFADFYTLNSNKDLVVNKQTEKIAADQFNGTDNFADDFANSL